VIKLSADEVPMAIWRRRPSAGVLFAAVAGFHDELRRQRLQIRLMQSVVCAKQRDALLRADSCRRVFAYVEFIRHQSVERMVAV